ncbi:glucosaminidase domain-containing protein [Candidatus Saccharibacteria bacterium]|nr:glucosaminidase domain-containing protein [Candidatus Saccharibacteria bacterium]
MKTLKSLRIKILLLAISILLSAIITPLTFATTSNPTTEKLLDFFSKNGIYYYNPDGLGNDCYAGLGSYDGTVSAGLSSLQAAFVDTYHDIAAQLGAEYGIPWEAVMAQGILESASGTSRFARERNNFFGIGAVDNNPDAAKYYSSPAEGWKGYFEFISNNPRYRQHGAFDHAGDPIGYIQAIKAAGYATDPNYVSKLAGIIKAVQNRAAEKGWASSGEIAENNGLLTGSSSSLSACPPTSAGNGDINATALALSWAERGHAIDDPIEAYRQALIAVDLNTYGDHYVQIGASCDAFVATVLRYSGADPNVPCCGANNMLNYFASHPALYEEITNTGNPANLQPGDIRASPGHVEIYVVDNAGNGRIASASHGDRTADHARGYYANSSMRIFRLRRAA